MEWRWASGLRFSHAGLFFLSPKGLDEQGSRDEPSQPDRASSSQIVGSSKCLLRATFSLHELPYAVRGNAWF